MKVKDVAAMMANPKNYKNAAVRCEAEKMMGIPFDKMTAKQRTLAAECIAAFYGKAVYKYFTNA